MMTALRTEATVTAVHLALLAFFFFSPKSHYFVATCVSTGWVWSPAFAAKRFQPLAIVPALAFQLALHQIVFRLSQAEFSAFSWPFAQVAPLQRVIPTASIA